MAARRILTHATLLLIMVVGACADEGTGREQVVIDGHTFELDYAVDPESRRIGLSGQTQLPENGGMLFVFPDPEMQLFWMYDCLMDIDIIYLDARGTVTAIHSMPAEPPRQAEESDWDYASRLPRYSSMYPAQFVIELPPGWLDRLDIAVDQRIDLDLPRLKAMAR
jgi:hypothetical protein